MITKELGRIKEARVGFGGYQDTVFGVDFSLGNRDMSVGDFWGANERTWSRLQAALTDAKVQSVDKLKNAPIEMTFEGSRLSTWRILTEVL